MKANDINGTTIVTRVLDLLGRGITGMVRWIAERQTRHTLWLELQAMNDEALRDLGITRRGIDAAVGRELRQGRTPPKAAKAPAVRIAPAANDDSVLQAA